MLPNSLKIPRRSPSSQLLLCGALQTMDDWRWKPEMETELLHIDYWRKSPQWVALNRAHAQDVVNDVHVDAQFAAHCRNYWDAARSWCAPS